MRKILDTAKYRLDALILRNSRVPGSRIQKLNKSELSEESQHAKGPKTVHYSSSCTSKNDIPLNKTLITANKIGPEMAESIHLISLTRISR